MKKDELKPFLEEKYQLYHSKEFIPTDPIQIPHQFSKKEDIEISAFLTATIAWGQRSTIIKNAQKLVGLMDNSPFDFVCSHESTDLKPFSTFVHRTFNGDDVCFFLTSLQNIYKNHEGLEKLFNPTEKQKQRNLKPSLDRFRSVFFSIPHLNRTQKHISDPSRNSACKRLNMFLRWMVRSSRGGVDFGLWKNIPTSLLSCPLDVHSGNVARKLGLLHRKQNDWKAVEELDSGLRVLDPVDPVKYDFALFGLGAFEKF